MPGDIVVFDSDPIAIGCSDSRRLQLKKAEPTDVSVHFFDQANEEDGYSESNTYYFREIFLN